MNSINNTVTGLASSLLLNFGFSTLAEKFDPMQNQAHAATEFLNSAEPCSSCAACNFLPEVGL